MSENMSTLPAFINSLAILFLRLANEQPLMYSQFCYHYQNMQKSSVRPCIFITSPDFKRFITKRQSIYDTAVMLARVRTPYMQNAFFPYTLI